MNDIAEPSGQLLAALNWRSITLPISWLSGPPRRSEIRKVPRAGMNTRMMPEMMPGLASGTTMLKKVRH